MNALRSIRAAIRRPFSIVFHRVTGLSPRLRESEEALREGDPERAVSLMAGLSQPAAADPATTSRWQRLVARASDRLAITAIYGLELMVAFIQAYVFAILTCVYLNDALHPGH